MALTKKVMGAVAAIALVLTTVLTFAFKPSEKGTEKQLVQQWYEYDGSGAVNDPTNYGNPTTTPIGCGGTDEVCSVFANEGTSGQPELTEALIDEINAALSNPSSSHPNVELRN